jgi:putative DNA primase/helicase
MTNNVIFTIASAASSHASRWKNTPTSWEVVAASLSQTVRTDETVKQYFAYTKDKQDKIKDVGGFVGGTLLGGTGVVQTRTGPQQVDYAYPYGWRRKGYVQDRQLVALDVDFGDFGAWFDFKELGFAGLMYTTHKHTPQSPRFRIVFPLDRPVGPDEYEAIARKVASWIDIEIFDDTTYQPTRLMYYPSTAKDGEFCYDVQDAPVLSADTVLATYGTTWNDWAAWPTSSREQSRRKPEDEAEDPTEKQGIIGAFCRAYPIEEAIGEFLEDIYEPCPALGPNRYSYCSGTTSGGLIIYGTQFAYSHHNTDPAGQRLCNAFDLVRLHKFGALDVDVADDITKAPSYKAMCHFASELGEVKKAVIQMRRENTDGSEYDELERKATTVAYNDDWIALLETEGKSATIKSTINNIVLVLRHDANMIDRFAYNEFEKREIVVQPLPWDKKGTQYPRPVEDSDDAQLRLYLERVYNISAVGKTLDALTVVLQENSVHPLKEYLDAMEWDGIDRVDSFFIDLFGADDTEYTRAVTRKWLCAAVARVYWPGIKFDYLITLVGDEGTGKSSVLDKIGGVWYNGNLPQVGTTAALEAIQGSWIIEVGELEGMNRADASTVKHFISTRIDQFRVAYGKRKAVFPRTCVFAGTTNEAAFLKSITGNRKFWVLNFLGKQGAYWWHDYLTDMVIAQVWAEARHLLGLGEKLFLPKHLEDEARGIQNAHLETDDRAGIVADYLDRLLPVGWEKLDPVGRRMWLTDYGNMDKGTVVREFVSVMEVWAECLGRPPEDITRRDSQDLGRVLRSFMDWHAVEGNPVRIPYYGQQRLYQRLVTPL